MRNEYRIDTEKRLDISSLVYMIDLFLIHQF